MQHRAVFRNAALRAPATALLAALTALGVVALPAVPAFAADTLRVDPDSQPNGAAVNDGSQGFTFDTDDTYLPQPSPTVTLTRVGASSDTISGTNVTVGSTGTTVSVDFDLTLANPGAYAVTITQTRAPSNVVDSCASCVTVLAQPPTVTSSTSSPMAAGGNAQTLTISGTNFTKGPYADCTQSSCTGPAIAFLNGNAVDPNITLTDALDSNNNVIAPTATTITKRILIAAGATAGPRTIEVVNSDGSTGQCTCTFDVTSAITATQLTPPALGIGSSGNTVTLKGANLPSDLTVRFARASDTTKLNDVTVGSVTPAADGVTAQLGNVVVSSSAQVGAQDVILSSASQHFTKWFSGLFQVVTPPAPTGVAYASNPNPGGIGGVPAADYGQGATNVTLTVTGSNFVAGSGGAGSTVTFANRTGITADTGQQTATTTSITVPLTLAQDAPVGSTGIIVKNPDGSSATCNNTSVTQMTNTCVFTIGAGPKVSSISPPSLSEGQSGTLTITGQGFNSPSLSLSKSAVNSTTPGSATSFTARVTAAPSSGSEDATVTNTPDNGRYVEPSGFSVDAIGVTGTLPTSAINNGTKQITVTGSNFDPDAFVTLRLPAVNGRTSPIDVVGATVGSASATSLTAQLPLTNVDPGAYQVIVTNPDAGSSNPGTGTCACVFAVLAPGAPTITSVSPNNAGSGAQNKVITVTGTNIYLHTTAAFSSSPQKVRITNSTYQAPSSSAPATLTLTVNVDPGATAAEAGNLTLTNTNGSSVSSPFTVNAAPSMSAVSPASRASSVHQFTMTFGAKNAVSGATVSFSGSGLTGGTATIAAAGTGTPAGFTQSVSVPVTIGAATVNQPYDVILTNPDGGTATCTGCFTVDNPPTLTQVSPSTGAVGTKPTVTLSGSGFATGATVTVTDGASSIPATVTTITSSAITATFDLTNAVKETAYDVTAINTDGGTATQPGAFTPFGVAGAPTHLTAQSQDQSALLNWTAPADDGGSPITSYTITTSAPTGSGGTTHSSTSTVSPPHSGDPVPTTATIGNLTNGVTYTFTVVANNAAGSSPASTSATAVPAGVPGAPTGVTATPGDRKATVSWKAPSNSNGNPITGYTVTASPGGAQASTDGTTLSTDVTGLTNGTGYTFTVTATSNAGTGQPSAPSSPVTPFGKPGAPTNVTATAGNQQADVSWTAAGDNGSPIDGYTVTTSPGGATTKVNGSTTHATATGLTNGVSYTFTVTAHNAAGDSNSSAPSNAVTPALPSAPVPTNVVATAGDQQATVSWTAPTPTSGDAISDYVVKTNPSGPTTVVSGSGGNAPGTTTTIAGLTNGSTYTFTVTAEYSPSGTKGQSTPSNAVTPYGVPGAPTGVTAKAGDGNATVSWKASTNDNGAVIDAYTVKATPGGRTATVPSSSTHATVTGLTNGTSYAFAVYAHNKAGYSTASGSSNAVTPKFVTHTTISAPITVNGGTAPTLSGTVHRSNRAALAGAKIALYAKPAGATSFTNYATVTTSSKGVWSNKHAFSRNTSVYAIFPGDSADASSSGHTTVYVRSTITISKPANGATVKHGRVVFTATAHYTLKGTKVVFQVRRSDGTWVSVAATTVGSNGAFSFTRTLSKGTLVYRMVIVNCSTNRGNTTSARTLHVT